MSYLLTPDFKQLTHISWITTDNQIFRLHYKFSATILFGFSVALTVYTFFGPKPIICMTKDDIGNPADGKADRIVDNYCWVEGTYTIPKYLNKIVGEEVAHPGVHKYTEGDEVIEHAYYQWVCFVLALLACLFCVPRLLWLTWEGRKVKLLVSELYKGILDDEKKVVQENNVVKYFVTHKEDHTGYAFKYFLCEVLNFINVIVQIFILDKFLGGEFLTYGHRVFQFIKTDKGDTEDPMIRAFPRVTKCTFHRFGPAGSVQKHDIMCALPLNILNEKIFAVLWVWFILLAILSGLAVVYRVAVFASDRIRFLVTKTAHFLADETVISNVISALNFGDWFILFQICYNIDPLHFKELMEKLNEELSGYNYAQGAVTNSAKGGSLPSTSSGGEPEESSV